MTKVKPFCTGLVEAQKLSSWFIPASSTGNKPKANSRDAIYLHKHKIKSRALTMRHIKF